LQSAQFKILGSLRKNRKVIVEIHRSGAVNSEAKWRNFAIEVENKLALIYEQVKYLK
jgi:hypothetical protein